MAINTTQSTTQLLAAQAAQNREAQAAEQVESAPVNLNASNAIGGVNQSLSLIANSLSAPDRRAQQQANLDRANAIRLEQQQYERDQAQSAFDYKKGQDAIDNAMAEKELDLRTRKTDADIRTAAGQLQVAKDKQKTYADSIALQNRGAEAKARIAEDTLAADKQFQEDLQNDPMDLVGFTGTPLYQDVDRFEKSKAEAGGSYSPVNAFVDKLPLAMQTNDTYDNLSFAVKGNTDKARKAVAKNDGYWNEDYLPLAQERALDRVGIQGGTGILFTTGEGELHNSRQFQEYLKEEMARLGTFEAKNKQYNKYKTKRDKAVAASTVKNTAYIARGD